MSDVTPDLRCTSCDKPVLAAREPCPWCGANRHVEYAGVWARFGAWLLDALFVWTAVLFVWFVVLDRFDVPVWAVAIGAVLGSWLWHAAWIASADGATPGHRIAGFGVRRRGTLARVDLRRAFVREIVKTLTFVVGNGLKVIGDAVMISASDRRQSLHDMGLDTVCVKERFLDAVEPLRVDAPHLDTK